MQLHLRLHFQRVELCAVRRDDEVIYTGFMTPVVGLGRVLGVEVSGRPFVELRVDGEGALVHFEVRIAHNDHFVETLGSGSPVDAVVLRAVAHVLPVLAVGLVADECAAI